MCPPDTAPAAPSRRRALVLFVNAAVGLIAGSLSVLLGAFVKPSASASDEATADRSATATADGSAGASAGRWVRAGALADLTPGVPVPRVLSVLRVDGWYRERARETVFLVWDGGTAVRALSATCTHLGCQVRWEASGQTFRCPCHGGVYAADGRVLEGPPPRSLDGLEARIDAADGAVLVRL